MGGVLRSRRPAAFPASAAILWAVAVLAAACGSDPAPPQLQLQLQVTSSSAAVSTVPSSTPPPVGEPTVTRTSKPAATKATAPAAIATDPLTGEKVNDNPLIAAKIDNTGAGRPQFGVSKADIVYVEQVEGGLTRLLALFRSDLPDEVGPIRSVRSTDAELLPMYGTPGLAFSGGAGGPLEALAKTPVVNLSADSAGAAYWRSDLASGTYNLHVNVKKLAETAGLGKPRSPGFDFAANNSRLKKYPIVKKLGVTMQTSTVGFTYLGGAKYQMTHGQDFEGYVDHDGSKVQVDNVLVQNIQDEPDGTVDSVGAPSFLSHTVGTGAFTLYRDGRAITGTWKRKGVDASASYLAQDGTPVKFRPGRTWVLLAPQSAVSTPG